MSTHRELVAAALQAIAVQSTTRCSWFGRRIRRLPRTVGWATSPEMARTFLAEVIRAQLYDHFYCQGGAVPERNLGTDVPVMGDTKFVQALSTVNSGRGPREPGWTVCAADAGRVVVERAGLRLWVRAAEVDTRSGAPLVPRAAVWLRMPKELPQHSPGYYTALGDEDLGSDAEVPIVRLYWNLRSEGAAGLMRSTTTRLRAARLPYRLKVVNAPASFTRCDAGVLYLRKCDYRSAAPIVAAIHAELTGDLKPLTPALTKGLAFGLGLAEEPASGESFGLHRCALLAKAISHAHELGVEALDDRLSVVAACFEKEGLDLATPYLNPGSADEYATLRA
jgi:hypothetical protein